MERNLPGLITAGGGGDYRPVSESRYLPVLLRVARNPSTVDTVVLEVPGGCSWGDVHNAVRWWGGQVGVFGSKLPQARAGITRPGLGTTMVALLLGATGCAISSTGGDRGRAGSSLIWGIINSLLIICCVNCQWPGVNHAYEMNRSLALMSAES